MSGIKKMRAAVLLLGCLLLTGIFAGCGKKEETPANTVSVYYINKEETKITAVEKEPEGDTLSKQAEWGISQLKENPVELSLRSPISGFTINSWNVKDDQLVLDMSVEYKKLSPSSEVLVRAAIVRTMTQLEGISYVSVTVGGEALTDSLGNVGGPMTADLFIDNAGNEINAYEKTRLLLYFTNESGERLIGVQTKPVVYSSNISMEKLIMEQLLDGPKTKDAKSAIPEGTKLVSVSVVDGVCYVSLDEAFKNQDYKVNEAVVIYSIVDSLSELSTISKVQISVNGDTSGVYRDNFPLADMYDRNMDYVTGAESAFSETEEPTETD